MHVGIPRLELSSELVETVALPRDQRDVVSSLGKDASEELSIGKRVGTE